MRNIDKNRNRLNLFKKRYINALISNNIKITNSSLISLRYLIFSNLDNSNLNKLEKKIKFTNFKSQLKNFFFLRNFKQIDFYGNTNFKNISKYKKMIITWSYNHNFKRNGEYEDGYFKSVKNKNKILWVTILVDQKLPIKIKKNTIIIHPKKGNLLQGINNILSYLKKLLLSSELNLANFFHQLSYDSYLANEIEKFFKNNNLLMNIKKLLIPLESQPFQNTIIGIAKEMNIETIGYDQTGNPFPFYNSYSPISPNKLVVHSISSQKFYNKNLNWQRSNIKRISSTRFEKKNKSFFDNKIFLPIMINNDEIILDRINYLFKNYSKYYDFKSFNIYLHPATKQLKKFDKLYKKIHDLKGKYKILSNKKIKKKISLHIGNTSTIIEALETGSEVIHICSSTLFDPITTSYWNSVKSKEITEGIFNYKLKRYGHCVTFKKKGKSLIL